MRLPFRTRLRGAVVLGALLGLLLVGQVAWGAFRSTTVVSQSLGTLTLGDVTGPVTATTTNGCSTVGVGWGAATNANSYRVQARTANGAWTDVSSETGNVTAFTDTTGYANRTMQWRVTSRRNGTTWESVTPATSARLTCGIGEVSDLAAANSCSASALTWSAAPNATSYGVQRQVNGGAWSTVASGLTSPGWSDPASFTPGDVVAYQVRGAIGATNGNWSNVASVASWNDFRATSVVVSNSGTLGTLNAGDSIAVTFSRPVTTSSVTSGATIRVVRNGASPRLYLGWDGTAGQVGQATPTANIFGATANYAGTATWSAGNTVLTWTSTGAGTTMSAALDGAWTVGTTATCAGDGTAMQAAPVPTVSGRW